MKCDSKNNCFQIWFLKNRCLILRFLFVGKVWRNRYSLSFSQLWTGVFLKMWPKLQEHEYFYKAHRMRLASNMISYFIQKCGTLGFCSNLFSHFGRRYSSAIWCRTTASILLGWKYAIINYDACCICSPITIFFNHSFLSHGLIAFSERAVRIIFQGQLCKYFVLFCHR